LRNLFIILIGFFSSISQAQDNLINLYAASGYDHNFTSGILLHTNGFGASFQYFRGMRNNRNLLTGIDIITLKHPKETKVVNPTFSDAKPYIYGKINSVILIRPGVGGQFIIADKENPMGIRVNFNFSLGADFALLKPDYIYIIYDDISSKYINLKAEIFDIENPIHKNQGNIYGGAGFFKGFDNMNASFGLYSKLSLSFEWNDYDETFRSLETGFMIDGFPEPLPIFDYIDNKSLFVNLFLTFNFVGRRW